MAANIDADCADPRRRIYQLSVTAYARLHLGFLDMHGSLGRNFGSLGLSLSDIFTRVTASRADNIVIHGAATDDRAGSYLDRILSKMPVKGIKLTVHQTIPEHTGLGSGTQLALAIGTAVAKLYGVNWSPREIAYLMGRGARSGIGVGAFTQGGFLVDSGRGQETGIPPIVSRSNFPEGWRVLLIFDDSKQGLSGAIEQEKFDQLPPMPEQVSAHLCRLVLMQVLPALAEQDCHLFGQAIMQIQAKLGEHFSPTQGGYFTSDMIADVTAWLMQQGATATGQSSWGPTGFAIFANLTQAEQALHAAQVRWQSQKNLRFSLCQGRNTMAEIAIDRYTTH